MEPGFEYKIVNRVLYICDKMGNPHRKISENVLFGTFDQATSMFLITQLNGIVEIKDTNGNIKRTISTDSIEARFSDGEIILRKKDGRTCIVDKMGNLRRYL